MRKEVVIGGNFALSLVHLSVSRSGLTAVVAEFEKKGCCGQRLRHALHLNWLDWNGQAFLGESISPWALVWRSRSLHLLRFEKKMMRATGGKAASS
jgi:hypothetical protein